MAAPYGRGTCPACGREMNLTKHGALRHHSGDIWEAGRPRICAGSGKPPKEA